MTPCTLRLQLHLSCLYNSTKLRAFPHCHCLGRYQSNFGHKCDSFGLCEHSSRTEEWSWYGYRRILVWPVCGINAIQTLLE